MLLEFLDIHSASSIMGNVFQMFTKQRLPSLLKSLQHLTYSEIKLGWCSPRLETSFRVHGENMLSVGLIKVGLFDLQRDARERSKYHIVQMEININATEFRIFINCFSILYLIDAFGGCFCTSSSYFRLQPSISLWIYVSKN